VTTPCTHTTEDVDAFTYTGTCPVCLEADRDQWRGAARGYAVKLATIRHLAAGKPGRFAAQIVAICDGVTPP
jgi:hypothetical protein